MITVDQARLPCQRTERPGSRPRGSGYRRPRSQVMGARRPFPPPIRAAPTAPTTGRSSGRAARPAAASASGATLAETLSTKSVGDTAARVSEFGSPPPTSLARRLSLAAASVFGTLRSQPTSASSLKDRPPHRPLSEVVAGHDADATHA